MAQPYTVLFGAWLPDLANVGVNMPFQYTATPLPCSDLLNVYYADAAYRSLPAPASIGPTLGVQITNAVNWYDDSTGKEIVFAATANGLYMLADGTWNAVPIVSSSGDNVTGQGMQISLGTLTPISYGIAPSSQAQSSTTTSFVFPSAEVVNAPGATAWSWYYTSQIGGTWSFSGSGASVTLSVSSVANATSATATLNCNVTINGNVYTVSAPQAYSNSHSAEYAGTMVAGQYTSGDTTFNGYDPSAGSGIGSISPSTDPSGHSISALVFVINSSSGDYSTSLEMSGFTSDPGQSYFATLVVGGNTFTSSSAAYSYSGGSASWFWSMEGTPFSGTLSVAINY